MPGFSTIFGVVYPLVALDPASSAYPAGRHLGNVGGLPSIDADLVAGNIKLGETIFGINGTMVSWVYDLKAKQAFGYRTIPSPPTYTKAAVEAHAAASTTTKTLVVPIGTRAIAAANSMLLIDDCEANIWDEFVGADVTSTIDAVVYQIGTHSAKLAVAGAAAVGRLATLDIPSTNLTTYNYIKMWVRSTVAISSADLHFLLDEHAQCVSALKTLNIGALGANTWTEVSLALGDASALGAIISIGINMSVDKGAFDFNVDQVRATKGV